MTALQNDYRTWKARRQNQPGQTEQLQDTQLSNGTAEQPRMGAADWQASGGPYSHAKDPGAELSGYNQAYAPSPSVQSAQDYLKSEMNSGSGGLQSRYSGQIADLYNQIMNRPGFAYDVNRDPLYQQYKDQYTVQGQRAMQDVMGQAAALTGGYGNSWGSTAGYQAYQYYLQMLGSRIPELEQLAFERYQYANEELRRYEEAMANAMRGGSGGKKKASEGDSSRDALVYPVLPANVEAISNNPLMAAVLSPTAARGITQSDWNAMQKTMESTYGNSVSKANQDQAALQAQILKNGAPSLTGLMVNAAKNQTVSGAVSSGRKKQESKKK